MRYKCAVVGWIADEGLIAGPRVVRDGYNFRSGVIEQANLLAAVGQSVADAPVVGINGDGESRRIAAAEEDDVRAGGDFGVGGELEKVARRRVVAQAPAS